MFRKRPVVIEARQTGQSHDEDCRIMAWCQGYYPLPNDEDEMPNGFIFAIETLEGPLNVTHGDWIIKGVANEFYPCKPSIFDATYEAT